MKTNLFSIAAGMALMLASFAASSQVSSGSDDLYINKTTPAPAVSTSPAEQPKSHDPSYSNDQNNSEGSNDYDNGNHDQQNASPDYSTSDQTQDGDGTTYITNNYYNGSSNDGGWYSSQLNHFYSPYMGFGYYDPFYTGFGFSEPFYSSPGLSLSLGFGFGYQPFYNPWYTSMYYPYWYDPFYSFGNPYSPYGYGYGNGYGYGSDAYGNGGSGGSNNYYGYHGSSSSNSSNDNGGRHYKQGSGSGVDGNINSPSLNNTNKVNIATQNDRSGNVISDKPANDIRNSSRNNGEIGNEKNINVPDRNMSAPDRHLNVPRQNNGHSPRENFNQTLNWQSPQENGSQKDANLMNHNNNQLNLNNDHNDLNQSPNSSSPAGTDIQSSEVKKHGSEKRIRLSSSTNNSEKYLSSYEKDQSSSDQVRQQPTLQRSDAGSRNNYDFGSRESNRGNGGRSPR